MNHSQISHASREIITESEYIINILKYLTEVVNFDPFDDATHPQIGEREQIIFLQKIELEI